MTTSTYKGRDVFNTTAGSLYVSMGGRDQEMTFGIGRIGYTDMYKTDANARTIQSALTTGTTVDGPNKGAMFNLAHLPSDAVVVKEFGKALETGERDQLDANFTYVVTTKGAENNSEDNYATAGEVANDIGLGALRINGTDVNGGANAAYNFTGILAAGDVIVVDAANVNVTANAANAADRHTYRKVNNTDNAFLVGHEYEIVSMGNNTDGQTVDAADIIAASTASGTLAAGTKFTVNSDATEVQLAKLNSLTQGMTFRMSTDTLTKDIESIQGLVNTARVQAGSQYAAIESAVNYTTDLTAQYELGYNTVNDVNFSMETAHLAKNQILQQAATAMLAQANQGQQGLLQLIS
jgi:flagellin